ncbi:MAG TPA: hypothetical protein VFW50_07425 [Streptosporangiaceae bacterium]|nr:hypothetical protein [Streptosporangiaceae bacterium]
MDEAAADQILLVTAGVRSAADRQRIRREARGNPLALLELPEAWTGAAAGWQPPTLSARLERAFAGRLAELPPRTRDAVLVAAVDFSDELPEILAGASRLAGRAAGVEALEEAAEAGLIRFDDLHIRFRHPSRSPVLTTPWPTNWRKTAGSRCTAARRPARSGRSSGRPS